MTEIYRITTMAGELLVSADTSVNAVGFARRGITAERLSGAAVRALPAYAEILDAHAEDTGEGTDGGEG